LNRLLFLNCFFMMFLPFLPLELSNSIWTTLNVKKRVWGKEKLKNFFFLFKFVDKCTQRKQKFNRLNILVKKISHSREQSVKKITQAECDCYCDDHWYDEASRCHCDRSGYSNSSFLSGWPPWGFLLPPPWFGYSPSLRSW